MKKISIMTYHNVYNYGAVPQAYATLFFFEKHGYEAELINYIPKKVQNYGSFSQLFYESGLFYSNPLKKLVISVLKMPSYRRQRKVFDEFTSCYLKTGAAYYSYDDLRINQPQCDILCTGSDQVWNNTYSKGFDLSYFLGFNQEKPMFAFSASFGRKDLKKEEIEYILPYLCRYKAISVREKSALEIIEKTKVPIKENIIDPTLMLSRDDWSQLFSKVNFDRYILVYQLHNESKAEQFAMKIAEEQKLQVVKIVTKLYQKSKNANSVVIPSVKEFLSLIDSAALVVTDSFHGTAFSINFNKDFVACLPGKTGERIQSICGITGLGNRIAKNIEDAVNIAKVKINYTPVNDILNVERAKAKHFLKDAVQACSE